ncbi:MAG: carbohydrate kinase family protein [Lachnospiraceae bacterium]|nr:carbohydrate kinase family protein [Lachnospiraceae bacterium]
MAETDCNIMENKTTDIICIGMALVDSIIKGFDPNPISASGYRAQMGSLNVGGEAVNEAIAASKLGMRTSILCTLGEDDAGETIISSLKRSGTDTSLIVRSKDHLTPVTTMFVNDDGTRRSITNTSHTYNFHPERYMSHFSRARAIILGSLFRAPFDDPQVIFDVLKEAKAKGLITVADTKLPNFRFNTLKDISDALTYIDFITPNEDEAKYYTGKNEPSQMADVFLEYGIKNVIIKLGSKGCYFKNRERQILLPAYDIDAVDATGAGDNFVAGFVTEILNGKDVGKALEFANACGAVCASAVGANTALRNREQIENFITDHRRQDNGQCKDR